MNKMMLAAAIALLATNLAFAQTAAPAAADKKPAAEKKAADADKKADAKAAAAEKKAAAKAAAADKKADAKAPATEKKADAKAATKKAPSEKQLKQREKMTTCNKEAGEKKLKGDERKKFMSNCLKG